MWQTKQKLKKLDSGFDFDFKKSLFSIQIIPSMIQRTEGLISIYADLWLEIGSKIKSYSLHPSFISKFVEEHSNVK